MVSSKPWEKAAVNSVPKGINLCYPLRSQLGWFLAQRSLQLFDNRQNGHT